MLQLRHHFIRQVHIIRGGAEPARQADGAHPAPLLVLKVGLEVRLFMLCSWKTELRLEHTQLVQISVQHGLLQFGEAKSRGLHTVAVGNIDEVDFGHRSSCLREEK